MHETMHRRQAGDLIYYTCDRLPARHGFTTKRGGVSTGDCESLNLGFHRGDREENVYQNYKLLAEALKIPYERITLTRQVHRDTVTVVEEAQVGTGLTKPMCWESDALVTALPNTPLIAFGADCVVTLLYDLEGSCCGVCHAGWRGIANGILGKTVDTMVTRFHADPAKLVAVIGPSIHACCFETDADVPEAMRAEQGSGLSAERLSDFVQMRGEKFFVDLQGIGAETLKAHGLTDDHVIDSGICTRCENELFWSHRFTKGKRGVQGGMVCLPEK